MYFLTQYFFSLLPLLSIWTPLLAIHLVHSFMVWGYLPLWGGGVLFMPVIAIVHYWHRKLNTPKNLFWKHTLFWAAFFAFWVFAVGFGLANHERGAWVKLWGPFFFVDVWLVYRLGGRFTIVCFLAWLYYYRKWTLKQHRRYLTTGLLLPIFLSILIFANFYYYGAGSSQKLDEILKQPAIEQVLDISTLKQTGLSNFVNSPRGLFFDETQNALFLAYGSTFVFHEDPYTTLVRYDFQTKETHSFSSGNIRRLDMHSDQIYVAPWFEPEGIRILSKKDLSLQKVIPFQMSEIPFIEVMNVFKDRQNQRVFLGNDIHAALVSYDIATGQREHLINFEAENLIGIGGNITLIKQSLKTGKLYLGGGPGNNIFEVDPETLKVLKHRSLNWIGGVAMELDDENQRLYFQDGVRDTIYEISLNTFEVLRTLEGSIHSKRLRVDSQRNRLYVLSFGKGIVFAIDLETEERLWNLKVGGKPHGMQLHKDHMWIHSMSGVFKIDLTQLP